MSILGYLAVHRFTKLLLFSTVMERALLEMNGTNHKQLV
jgi:hypothetical protein